jgi:hypothetical protein
MKREFRKREPCVNQVGAHAYVWASTKKIGTCSDGICVACETKNSLERPNRRRRMEVGGQVLKVHITRRLGKMCTTNAF